ncbi:MAG: tRNA (adenosine(37)-N6)-threonylcarbamoyltransferase complex dimerization subunit type 1 TsaB [Melioribacteraceae bacterium]
MNEDKKILSIETSGELCSVALYFSEKKYDERNILMKHIHSEKLVPMIEELLNSNSVKTNELDWIAVSNGPGSFTGLRIGMTTAKGLAFASSLPILPVPTFDALALQVSSYIDSSKIFCICNNANIEEFYFAKYRIEDSKPIAIIEQSLEKKNELEKLTSGIENIFGNLKQTESIKDISSPTAFHIAKWSYLYGQDLLTFEYDYLEPNYLKKFKVKT